MPIIPQGQESVQTQVSAPVPISGTGDARMVGERIAHVGDVLENFGAKQAGMQRELDKSEGSSKINDAIQQSFIQAKREAKPDGSDLGELAYAKAEPQIADIMNTYGGDRSVRNHLNEYTMRVKGDADTQIMITSGQMLESHNLSRLDDLKNQAGDRLRENPSNPNLTEAEMTSYGTTLDNMVKAGAITPEKAQKARDQFAKTASMSLLDGMDNQGRYTDAIKLLSANQENPGLNTELDPKTAQSLGLIDDKEARLLMDSGENYKVPVMTKGTYKLTPSQAQAINGLTPEEKSHYLDYFRKKAEEKTKINLHDLNERVSAAIYEGRAGNQGDPQEYKALIGEVMTVPNSQLPPIAKRRLVESMTRAQLVAAKVPEIASTPRDQREGLVSDAVQQSNMIFEQGQKVAPIREGDFVRQKGDNDMVDLIRTANDNAKVEEDKDFAKYSISNDKQAERLYNAMLGGSPKDSQAYASYMLQRANYIGVSKSRILPKSKAMEDSYKIQGVGDAYQTSQLLNSEEARWGKNFSRVFNEMAAGNKEFAKLGIALFAPPESRANLIDGIKHEKEIDKAFADKFGTGAEFKKKAILEGINATEAGQMDKVYSSSSENSGGYERVANLKKAMELQIKRDAAHDPSASITDLSKKAYNDLIGSQYQIVDTPHGTTLAPKNIGGTNIDSKYIAGYMNVNARAENFKDLGVAVPPQFKGFEEKYYDELSKRVRWSTTDDGAGVVLKAPDAQTGQLKPVMNSNGKPIAPTFREMNMADEKVRAEVRSFAGKMFDAVGGVISKGIGAISSGDATYIAPVKPGEAKQ